MLSAPTSPPMPTTKLMPSTWPTCTPPAPSSRPTSRPTRLPQDLRGTLRPNSPSGGIPVDLAVPVRLRSDTPSGLDLRAAFLLAHVDNQSSIEQIARSAQIPTAEARANFLSLVSAGVIAIGIAGADPEALGEPPSSRVTPRQNSDVPTAVNGSVLSASSH